MSSIGRSNPEPKPIMRIPILQDMNPKEMTEMTFMLIRDASKKKSVEDFRKIADGAIVPLALDFCLSLTDKNQNRLDWEVLEVVGYEDTQILIAHCQRTHGAKEIFHVYIELAVTPDDPHFMVYKVERCLKHSCVPVLTVAGNLNN